MQCSLARTNAIDGCNRLDHRTHLLLPAGAHIYECHGHHHHGSQCRTRFDFRVSTDVVILNPGTPDRSRLIPSNELRTS